MKNEVGQRCVIAAALFCTKSTTSLLGPYEQLLADQYIHGTLSIYESVALLEAYKRHQVGSSAAAYSC
jgi:hypothetical protein